MSRVRRNKLVLPGRAQAERVVRERKEMLKTLKERLQEVKDEDYTLSEIFTDPRDSDNAGITTFRIACFLIQMSVVWKNRSERLERRLSELERAVIGDDPLDTHQEKEVKDE